MATIYTPKMLKRDDQIRAWRQSGKKYDWIMQKTGLCHARIYQIVTMSRADIRRVTRQAA